MSEKLFELHREGIINTLAKLEADSDDQDTLSVGRLSLHSLLSEVFELRWQNRQLQARGTELVTANRSLERNLKRYAKTLAFVGRAVGTKVNRDAIHREHPELFCEDCGVVPCACEFALDPGIRKALIDG